MLGESMTRDQIKYYFHAKRLSPQNAAGDEPRLGDDADAAAAALLAVVHTLVLGSLGGRLRRRHGLSAQLVP